MEDKLIRKLYEIFEGAMLEIWNSGFKEGYDLGYSQEHKKKKENNKNK